MWPFSVELNAREAIGLVLLIISIALAPVAWMTSRLLWVVAGLLFVLGAVLLYSDRILKREAESTKEGDEAHGPYTGPKMSGDVF